MSIKKELKEVEAYFKQVSFLKNDKEMQEIMKKHLFEEVYGHGTLSFEMREYITLAILVANDGYEIIKDHILALHSYGIAPEIMKEAMYQAIPYAGLLKVNTALKFANEAFTDLGIHTFASGSQVDESTRFEKGFAAQCSVFSKEVIQIGHEQSPKELKHIQASLSAHCFGDFYTRKGLNMQERELITFCVIASLGGCENQLRSHANANLNAGNTRDMLIEAITQCQPYIGYPRTLNAINIINEVAV